MHTINHLLTNLLAGAVIATTVDVPSVVYRDVLIVGGGASGAYAAVRLREDFGKSILLVEKENILVTPKSLCTTLRVCELLTNYFLTRAAMLIPMSIQRRILHTTTA